MHKSILYKNIYYILMYAIEELRDVKLREIDMEKFKALNDLYAAIIINSMEYVLNNGVLQEYRRVDENTRQPKGRVYVAESIEHGRYQNGIMGCRYYELAVDTDVNRVIKLAIKVLLKYTGSMIKDNASNLKLILSFLNKVKDVGVKDTDFRGIDTASLSVDYKTAYYMSKLILEEFITKENGGNRRIIEMEDTERMNKIFEKFVRNYFVINYNSRYIRVGARQFNGVETAHTIYNKSKTDITIENRKNNRVVIIDTKWYKKILENNNRINAANQRQIKDYVRDYMDNYGNKSTYITGILLYAKPNMEVDIDSVEKDYLSLKYYNGHEYARIYTIVIDLESEFEDIKSKLDTIFIENVM